MPAAMIARYQPLRQADIQPGHRVGAAHALPRHREADHDQHQDSENRAHEQQQHELPAGAIDHDAATNQQPQWQNRNRPELCVVQSSPCQHGARVPARA